MMRPPQRRAAAAPRPTTVILVLLTLAYISSRRALVNGFTNGPASQPRLTTSPLAPKMSSSEGDDDGFLGMFRWSEESKPEAAKSGFRNVPGSNGQMMDRPGVAVKPRPIVTLDEETGKYEPASKNPISVAPKLSTTEDTDDSASAGGSLLKDLFYGSVDAINTVATATEKVGSALGILPPQPMENESVLGQRPEAGYGDTVETPGSAVAEEAPGARLLKQYEAQREKEREAREQIVRAAARPQRDDFDDDGFDDDEDEEMYEEDTKSALDAIGDALGATKDGIYGAVDFISGGTKKGESEPQPSLSRPIDAVSSSSAPPFRPVAKPSQNEDETVLQVQSLLPDLTSTNPLKRTRAELALRSAEAKRRRKEAEEARREGVRKAKEAAYAVADGVKTTAEIVVTAPVKAVDSTVKAVSAIPEVVEGAVETIQSIPVEVDKKLMVVQKTADQTTQFAKDIAEDVQNLPSTVRAKVDETKRTVEETKKTTIDLTRKATNAVYDAQVVLGLKPLRPKPPPPPPPPPTLEEQGVRAATSTAEAATKVAWFVGKGTFRLASAGAKAAWGSTLGQTTNAAAEKPRRRTVKTSARVQSPIRTVESLPTLSDIDTGLDKEVSDALRLAEEALSAASSAKVGEPTEEVEKPPKPTRSAVAPAVQELTIDPEPTAASAAVQKPAVDKPKAEKERRRFGFGLSRAKSALGMGKEEKKEQAKAKAATDPAPSSAPATPEKAAVEKEAKAILPPTIMDTSTAATIEVSGIDEDLSREVSDAQKLAAEALLSSTFVTDEPNKTEGKVQVETAPQVVLESSSGGSKRITSIEIDIAVKRAREAAAQAAKEAAEVGEMLRMARK